MGKRTTVAASGAVTRVDRQDRIRSAAIVAVFHALLGYALIAGLGVDVTAITEEPLRLFDIAEPPPPPPLPEPVPPPQKSKEKAARIRPAPKGEEGAAAPPNLKSSPTQIVAPERAVELPVPTPVTVAPVAGPGAQADAGASDRPGPGTGAGGQGDGLGSGRGGDGTGGGGGGGVATPARQIAGRIYDRDIPCRDPETCRGGTVGLRFVVAPNGRVSSCTVTRTSGDRDLDGGTCALIRQRFRFRPARDEWGRPVPFVITGSHEWNARVEPDRWVEAEIPDDE